MKRTDRGRLDHVADSESLDGLVLGGASRAVGATDGLDVTATGLVASAIVKENPPSASRISQPSQISSPPPSSQFPQ
jgi:hypothetical protein